MLYIYFGDNTSEVRQKALQRAHTLLGEGSSMTHVTADAYTGGSLIDLAHGASLFGQEEVILLDTPSEDVTFFEEVIDGILMLDSSPNHFVIIERAFSAAEKKKFLGKGEMHEVAGKEKDSFNTFALTDALLMRDKKALWILLMEAWRKGVANEEIVGVLFWQLKILRLAEKTKSAEEAGQKPFVYQKAKRALTKFKQDEPETLSRELLKIYHDGHMGKADLSLGLERWVLKM